MNLLVTLFVALASTAICSAATKSFHLVADPAAASEKPATQQRFNFFDVELMRYAGETYKGNFMLSPASIKATLAMLLEGAQGQCGTELRRALRLPDNPEQMRDQLNAYLASLRMQAPGISLESSNRIFLSRNYEVIKSYQKLLMDIYYSEVQLVNFEDPLSTANSINSWISEQTNGLINELVDPFSIEANSVLVLANALYFKGKWNNSFDAEDTHPHCFHTEVGCQEVYMMENQGDYKYGFIPEINAQAVEIPYQSFKYSMLILLPGERFGASSVIRDLPFVSVPQILNQMEVMDVQLSLPRFQMDFSENLVDILQKVGINLIFSPSSNLTGMVKGSLSPLVNDIFHKTRIEVNEEGSVAAAGTGAMVIPLMGTNTARVLVDHPFLFFIRDMNTDAIIFEGRVDLPDLVAKTSKQPSLFLPNKKPQNQVQSTSSQSNSQSVTRPSTNSPKRGSNSQNVQKSPAVKPVSVSRPDSAQTRPAQTKPVSSQNNIYNSQTNGAQPQSNNYPSVNSNQYPGTNSNQYPATNSNQYPTSNSNQYPATNSNQYPTSNSNQNSATNSNQYPSSSSNQYPSMSVNQISQPSQAGYGVQSLQDENLGTADRFALENADFEQAFSSGIDDLKSNASIGCTQFFPLHKGFQDFCRSVLKPLGLGEMQYVNNEETLNFNI